MTIGLVLRQPQLANVNAYRTSDWVQDEENETEFLETSRVHFNFNDKLPCYSLYCLGLDDVRTYFNS